MRSVIVTLLLVFCIPSGVQAETGSRVEPWITVPPDGPPSGNCLYFEATRHYICDEFLAAWQGDGLDMGDEGISYRESLALFGYPLTQVFEYEGLRMQVWERFVAEAHPGNPWSPVLFRLLGNELAASLPQEFVDSIVPDNTCFGMYFPETQKCLQEPFQSFWERNGELLVFGYPKNDGNADLTTAEGTFRSQLFERQLLEVHPENSGTPYEILLARLGAMWLTSLLERPACPEGIPAGLTVFIPAGCLIIGDVELSHAENGPYVRYYDDNGNTGLVVIVREDAYAKTSPHWGAAVLKSISQEEVDAQVALLKSPGGCGLESGCTDVTIGLWPQP